MRLIVPLLALAVVSLRADSLDDFYQRVIKERNVPSTTIAVVKDGKLVKVGAYGTADLERGTPARPETVYKIGSVSKQFIAAGIMLLAQDGRLSVDDPVSKYIATAPASWKAITLRHLLTHSSGLVREPPGFDANTLQPDLDVIASAFASPLQWMPGDKYGYSNLGYYALAEVIHIVSNQRW